MKEFFADGKPKTSGTMKDNEYIGELIVFFPNGKVWQRGSYKNGLKEGVWMIFKESGEKDREDKYHAGVWLNPIKLDGDEVPIKEEGK
ncbi:MAG: hypothetical protein IPP51_02525 [Bacteroidetes bacterium]|nr:hypothetical protein [Bacteroidota bacterium]